MQKEIDGRKRALTVVSDSEVRKWRDCHALWGFVYPEGLQPRRTPAYFIHGRIIHKAAEAGARAWRSVVVKSVREQDPDPWWRDVEKLQHWVTEKSLAALGPAVEEAIAQADQVIRSPTLAIEVVDEIRQVEELARFVIPRHWEKRRADFRTFVPMLIEHSFEVRVRDAGGRRSSTCLRGRLDLGLLDLEAGQLAVTDMKTTSGDPWGFERRLPIDPQTTGYVYALREQLKAGELDELLEAVGWDFSRGRPSVGRCYTDAVGKKPPVHPRTLKDGTITVAVTGTANTPPEWYEKALVDAGEPEWLKEAVRSGRADKREKAEERWAKIQDKQAARLEELRSQRERWIVRHEHYRTPDELERWRAEFLIEAARMREAERRPALRTRNPAHCSGPGSRGCRFWDLCTDPGNEDLRDQLFSTREERAAAREKTAEQLAAEREAEAKATEPTAPAGRPYDPEWDLF